MISGQRPHNLPVQPSSLIGREDEIAAVSETLCTTPLLTLIGSGGVGKTRLALAVADRVWSGYPDGAWLVELAPVSDPALVPKTIASVLQIPEQARREVTEVLADALRLRRLLLILDNCEHLVQACAETVDALLRACPQVRILATSRQALRLAGESVWRVPSLGLPEDELDTRGELPASVRLFVARARSVLAEFALTEENASAVGQIARSLDGVPLALELAAARAASLSPHQIAVRLSDRLRLLTGGSRTVAPRQQTLRGALDWSHALLSAEERVLFRRLAVFAGGWALEAAERVCSAPPLDQLAVIELLASLAEKSL